MLRERASERVLLRAQLAAARGAPMQCSGLLR